MFLFMAVILTSISICFKKLKEILQFPKRN
uniref:Uncharacterized protein n=1 Tax=Arundo donax TaxID=35708 RepID=A0A0A8XWN8_ARUDO